MLVPYGDRAQFRLGYFIDAQRSSPSLQRVSTSVTYAGVQGHGAEIPSGQESQR
jgi:recombinational DNA repair protein RecT